MKRNYVSIKWQIVGWMILVILVVLLVSALFGVLLATDLYKEVKLQNTDEYMDNIISSISGRSFERDCLGSEAWKSSVREYCEKSYNAVVIKKLGTDEVYAINMLPFETELSDSSFCDELIRLASQKNGEYALADNRGGVGSVYFVRMVSASDGTVAVLMNTTVRPTEAFVLSSRWIFISSSISMFIIAIILGTIVTKRISKPLAKLSDSSKNIVEGRFDYQHGKGRGYKEINQLNASLSAAAKEISKTETFQKELIANISHDLRTPLTIISGYAEMMKDFKDADHTESIEGILNETRRMSELVNDIMDLSQIESGAMYHDEPMSLTTCIYEAKARFAQLKEQGYEVIFNPTHEVIIKADEKRIMQVIYNFIANAINYGGEDKKVFVEQEAMGSKVKVSVRDNGVGIPEESLKDIWQRYFKIDKEHRRAGKGTGLGLTIVKGILENYSAEYGVESKVGKGSTFWFVMDAIEVK